MNRLKVLCAVFAFAFVGQAAAQTSPNFIYGQVYTAGQINAAFIAKQDVLGFTPLNSAGGTMAGPFRTAASTTSSTGFSILPGVAPSTPNNGDMWVTSSGLYVQINGLTIGPISNGTGTVTGPGTSTSGHVATFSNTSGTAIQDGGQALPSSAVVGISDSQTLTNKSIAATEINSGTLPAAQMPALTGDCTTSSGAVATTCTKTSGTAFTSTATASAGQLPATATNDNGASGKLGEYVSTTLSCGSAVSLTTNTATGVASISLTAGDWDVRGTVTLQNAPTTAITGIFGDINTSVAFHSTPGAGSYFGLTIASVSGSAGFTFPLGITRVSLSSTSTIYLVAQETFTTSTASACGFIGARRVR